MLIDLSKILSWNQLLLFSLLFIPGFIAVNIYDLIFTNEVQEFSKKIMLTIMVSIMNYLFIYLVLNIFYQNINVSGINNNEIYKILSMHPFWSIFSIFVAPMVYPFVALLLINYSLWPVVFSNPVSMAWDNLFRKGEPYWVIIYLKNGCKVGGKYADKSFASAFPKKKEILLEEEWEVNDKGEFINKMDPERGVLVNCDDMLKLEYYVE